LKGKATEELSAELVDMVGSVPGVRSVEDHLSVPQRS
jgi:hypothetical protein